MNKSCEVCGTDNNIGPIPPIMMSEGGRKRFICNRCFTAWYEGAGVTPEEIRKSLGLKKKEATK